MARSLTDALVKAGLILPEDTPKARQERAWRERRKERAREIAARMEDSAPLPSWERSRPAETVESARTAIPATVAVCAHCGERFDPTAAEHRQFGRADSCGPCARGEAPGPRRKRGQMIWTHKTAPTLEIEGGRKLTPEEFAAMRRR